MTLVEGDVPGPRQPAAERRGNTSRPGCRESARAGGRPRSGRRPERERPDATGPRVIRAARPSSRVRPSVATTRSKVSTAASRHGQAIVRPVPRPSPMPVNAPPRSSRRPRNPRRRRHPANGCGSLLGQTVAEIELVVVDDCSTDRTRRAARGDRRPRVWSSFATTPARARRGAQPWARGGPRALGRPSRCRRRRMLRAAGAPAGGCCARPRARGPRHRRARDRRRGRLGRLHDMPTRNRAVRWQRSSERRSSIRR